MGDSHNMPASVPVSVGAKAYPKLPMGIASWGTVISYLLSVLQAALTLGFSVSGYPYLFYAKTCIFCSTGDCAEFGIGVQMLYWIKLHLRDCSLPCWYGKMSPEFQELGYADFLIPKAV